MNIINSSLAVILALIICSVHGITISGKVTDTGGTPLPGATVQLEKTGFTATTGADGCFTLTGVVNIAGCADPALTPSLSATANNGLMRIMMTERSLVEITTYTVQGKVIAIMKKPFNAGTHFVSMPQIGAGTYIYRIKTGKGDVVLKSTSMGCASGSTKNFSSEVMLKQTTVAAAIDDVLAVTKSGYLNYRMTATNPDTTGIVIKMIVCDDTVIDVDENVYQAVKIGTQVWAVENLRTTKYNDGSAIPLITDDNAWQKDTMGAYCYYNNTARLDSIKKFGALYNWYAVNTKKLAPAGWHVPTGAEWNTLQVFLIAKGYNWDVTVTGNKIAKSMAAKTDWWILPHVGAISDDLTKNNSSGFSALPGGWRLFYCNLMGGYGFWWSASATDSGGTFFSLHCIEEGLLSSNDGDKHFGFSVKLLKD